MKRLFHFRLAEAQFCVVIAGRQQSFRIIAAVFDADVFGRAQVPVQPSESGRARRFQIRHRLAVCFRYRDFDFIAGEFFHPNRKQRALLRIFASINPFAIGIDKSRLQIRAGHIAHAK